MRRWFLRPIPVLLICGFIVFVLFISNNFKSKNAKNALPHFDFNYIKANEVENDNNGHNAQQYSEKKTPLACQSPQVPVDSPVMMAKFKPHPDVNCDMEPDWVFVEAGHIRFRPNLSSTHPGFSCLLTPVTRKTDFAVELEKEVPLTSDGLEMPSEGAFVACKDQGGKSFKTLLHSVVRRPELVKTLQSRLLSTMRAGSSPQESPQVRPPDIIMIGTDSMSRNAWRRYLPKTYEYFSEGLGGIILEGYNIVGDGTPQALLPILTGLTEYELPEARRSKSTAKPVDGHPWIWKNFSSAGYRTMWIEDDPDVGTFTYRMLGFQQPPTDSYGRMQWIARHRHKNRIGRKHAKCDFSLHQHISGILNPLHEHLRAFPDIPTFSFVFQSESCHNDNNPVRTLDNLTKDFLVKLNAEGRFDNAILIMMSDHGARFANRDSEEGKIEERKPMFGFRFPQWFVDKYPSKVATFRLNAKERLVTPFDIHATFHHLLDFQREKYEINHFKQEKGVRAISLLQEIPTSRTCAQADIEPHWCACLNWRSLPISESSPPSSKSSVSPMELCRSAVGFLNALTAENRAQCVELKLKTANRVAILETPVEMRKFKKTVDADGFVPDLSDTTKQQIAVYSLKFTTAPNDGVYEMTIELKNEKLQFDQRTISRTNMYGDQPKCIADKLPHLRKYCYCK